MFRFKMSWVNWLLFGIYIVAVIIYIIGIGNLNVWEVLSLGLVTWLFTESERSVQLINYVNEKVK
jgi:hypothetical protein